MPSAARRAKDKVRKAAGVPARQRTPVAVLEAMPAILEEAERKREEMSAKERSELEVIERESELATMRRVLNQTFKEDRTAKEKRLRLWLNENVKAYMDAMRMWEREESGSISRNQVAAKQELEPDEKAGEIQVLIKELLDRCNSGVHSGQTK